MINHPFALFYHLKENQISYYEGKGNQKISVLSYEGELSELHLKKKALYKKRDSNKFSSFFKIMEKLYIPDFETYKRKFDELYEELYRGNLYQANLTFPFKFKVRPCFSDIDEFINLFSSLPLSALAHVIGNDQKIHISNTPECLFEYHKREHELVSYPIKGTIKSDSSQNPKETYDELVSHEKDEGELYMISDLVRNDLSRVQKTISYVVFKKKPLYVPGLIHHYSVIKTYLNKDSSIAPADILSSLFPGGSITGAPKIASMRYLKQLELEPRGFYCGSTLLETKNKLTASINIRSATFDLQTNELTLNAGGGITLKSNAQSEYLEMCHKFESLFYLLTKTNLSNL